MLLNLFLCVSKTCWVSASQPSWPCTQVSSVAPSPCRGDLQVLPGKHTA